MVLDWGGDFGGGSLQMETTRHVVDWCGAKAELGIGVSHLVAEGQRH